MMGTPCMGLEGPKGTAAVNKAWTYHEMVIKAQLQVMNGSRRNKLTEQCLHQVIQTVYARTMAALPVMENDLIDSM